MYVLLIIQEMALMGKPLFHGRDFQRISTGEKRNLVSELVLEKFFTFRLVN
jgi:hypothetical protein